MNRNVEQGTYFGFSTNCPVVAWGICPYCDQEIKCHLENPAKECYEWIEFNGEDWDMWVSAQQIDEENK